MHSILIRYEKTLSDPRSQCCTILPQQILKVFLYVDVYTRTASHVDNQMEMEIISIVTTSEVTTICIAFSCEIQNRAT